MKKIIVTFTETEAIEIQQMLWHRLIGLKERGSTNGVKGMIKQAERIHKKIDLSLTRSKIKNL